MAVTTPKLRVPLEMGSTGFRVVEQDSVDEVAQCVYAILATPLESRVELPDFGVSDPTFEPGGADLVEWQHAIAEYEPRATAQMDQELDTSLDRIRVKVGLG